MLTQVEANQPNVLPLVLHKHRSVQRSSSDQSIVEQNWDIDLVIKSSSRATTGSNLLQASTLVVEAMLITLSGVSLMLLTGWLLVHTMGTFFVA